MRALADDGWVTSLAWVLMPDHLHWLFALERQYTLGNVLRRLKGRSARRINEGLGAAGPLWQSAFHDHALRDDEDLAAVARYIVANPLRAGLVDRLSDYPHWDALWL